MDKLTNLHIDEDMVSQGSRASRRSNASKRSNAPRPKKSAIVMPTNGLLGMSPVVLKKKMDPAINSLMNNPLRS